MIRRPPRSTLDRSSAASDVYKRQPFAQRLGISEADPQGFLIMGADRFACELGAAIKKAGFVVRLVDVNRANVLSARLRGLDAIQGNILSEYVESELDLSGIGRLRAV